MSIAVRRNTDIKDTIENFTVESDTPAPAVPAYVSAGGVSNTYLKKAPQPSAGESSVSDNSDGWAVGSYFDRHSIQSNFSDYLESIGNYDWGSVKSKIIDTVTDAVTSPLAGLSSSSELSGLVAAAGSGSLSSLFGTTVLVSSGYRVERLLNSLADFEPNMFDAYIVRADALDRMPDGAASCPIFDTETPGWLGSNSTFMVRAASVSVPGKASETYTVPFLTHSIRRVASSVSFKNTAVLTLNLDQGLYYYNAMSAQGGHYYAHTNISSVAHTEGAAFVNTYLYNLFPFVVRRKRTYSTSGGTGLDLIVRMHDASGTLNYDRETSASEPENQLSFAKGNAYAQSYNAYLNLKKASSDVFDAVGKIAPAVKPYYVFEDIRILGKGEPVEFSRDSANSLTGSWTFAFRRVVREDPSAKKLKLTTV